MSKLIINPEGWGKASHSGNGGNCLEAKVVTQQGIAAPAASSGDGMDWSKA